MAKNFYAIRTLNGEACKKILTSWDECSKLVKGNHAEYKGFTTRAEADKYLNTYVEEEAEQDVLNTRNRFIFYVDGSFDDNTNKIGWSLVLIQNYNIITRMCGGLYHFAGTTSRNITGELEACKMAIRFAISNGIKDITVIHDYQGISSFITGSMEPSTSESKEYTKWVKDKINNKQINIKFVKVKGHTNNEFNDEADRLAKLGTTL